MGRRVGGRATGEGRPRHRMARRGCAGPAPPPGAHGERRPCEDPKPPDAAGVCCDGQSSRGPRHWSFRPTRRVAALRSQRPLPGHRTGRAADAVAHACCAAWRRLAPRRETEQRHSPARSRYRARTSPATPLRVPARPEALRPSRHRDGPCAACADATACADGLPRRARPRGPRRPRPRRRLHPAASRAPVARLAVVRRPVPPGPMPMHRPATRKLPFAPASRPCRKRQGRSAGDRTRVGRESITRRTWRKASDDTEDGYVSDVSRLPPQAAH